MRKSESALHAQAPPSSVVCTESALVPYSNKGGSYPQEEEDEGEESVAAQAAQAAAPKAKEEEAASSPDHLEILYRKLETERAGYFAEIFTSLYTTIHIQYLKVWQINSFSMTLARFELDCQRSNLMKTMMSAIEDSHEHRENLRNLKEAYDLCEAKFMKCVRDHAESHEAECLANGRYVPFTQEILMEMLTVDEDSVYNQLQMWKVEIASVRRQYNFANRIVSDCHRDFDRNTEAREQLKNSRLVDKIVSQLDEARKVDMSKITEEVINRMDEYNDKIRDKHEEARQNNILYERAMDNLDDTRADFREREDEAQSLEMQENEAYYEHCEANDEFNSGRYPPINRGGINVKTKAADSLMSGIFTKLNLNVAAAPATTPRAARPVPHHSPIAPAPHSYALPTPAPKKAASSSSSAPTSINEGEARARAPPRGASSAAITQPLLQ